MWLPRGIHQLGRQSILIWILLSHGCDLIDIYYSLVAHPRCNGQVERANDMVLQALKDRTYDDASNYSTRWLVELPHMIWGLMTKVSSALSGLQIRSCPTY
jgi:hypothetical protein